MGFLNYLFMGAVAYALGWAIQLYVLGKQPKPKTPYNMKHPVILGYLAGFFVVMMGVSALIGRFMLGHDSVDIPFILVNSAVATFVFSFGLSPDTTKHELPD